MTIMKKIIPSVLKDVEKYESSHSWGNIKWYSHLENSKADFLKARYKLDPAILQLGTNQRR